MKWMNEIKRKKKFNFFFNFKKKFRIFFFLFFLEKNEKNNFIVMKIFEREWDYLTGIFATVGVSSANEHFRNGL